MADTHELDPGVCKIVKKLQRREVSARYLLAMVDGNNTMLDISRAMVEGDERPNVNAANNALFYLVKSINGLALAEWGEPLIVKDAARSPYSCNASTVEKFALLRYAMLPMDMSVYDPTLFMSKSQQEAHELSDPRLKMLTAVADRVMADLGNFEVSSELVVGEDGSATYLPSADLKHIYRTVATDSTGGFEGQLDKSRADELNLTSAKVHRLNELSFTLVNEPLFGIMGEIDGGRKKLKFNIDLNVLKRLALFGNEVATLPEIRLSSLDIPRIEACIAEVNDFVNGRLDTVGFVGEMGIKDSLLIRQMLEGFETEDRFVLEKRSQLLFLINRRLACWSVVRKKDISARNLLHSLVAEGRPDGGACKGTDPDLFFPERGESTREAKGVCRGCSVRSDCLEFSLRNGEKFGIWGGLSERERRRLRRQRSDKAKKLREVQKDTTLVEVEDDPVSDLAAGE
jgi:WhiB family redox-sensing transcriptional regulator